MQQFKAQLSAGCRAAERSWWIWKCFPFADLAMRSVPSLGDFRAGGDVELHQFLSQLQAGRS